MFEELNLLEPFFKDPEREFGIREFAVLRKLSPATASTKLKKFTKKQILKSRKERIYLLFKANLENELYKDLKIFYNLQNIKKCGLVEKLNSFYMKPTIIFFGSGSLGLDAAGSDFDIAVISERVDLPDITKYEKKLHRKIQLFAVKELKDLKNEHLINSIINGITLQGGIKWI
ncbi:MAG: hypothetical protein KKF44_10185 [Nanoarchaeota archaeon]|nr:hypothetical protein [Nanoarchaeota archaeon]